jgi:hypothetical protein
MKKYHMLIFFLLKQKEGIKRVFFCGVLFREDSFRDIVRKKIINDERYVSSNECYKSVVMFLPVVFEESVSETDMSECREKRTNNIMRYFAVSMRRP